MKLVNSAYDREKGYSGYCLVYHRHETFSRTLLSEETGESLKHT